MLSRELDLLLDILALCHLIEVLDADLATGAHPVCAIVRPARGINAPAFAAVLALQGIVEPKPAHENDLISYLAKDRDAVFSKPAGGVRGVVIMQDLAELLVRGLSYPLTLHRHDHRLAGVGVQELEDHIYDVPEVLVAREGNGECAVYKNEPVLLGVLWVLWLHSDVQESNTILELLLHTDGLAPN